MKQRLLPLLLALAFSTACDGHEHWNIAEECAEIVVPGFIVNTCGRDYVEFVPFLSRSLPVSGVMTITYVHHPATRELISFSAQTNTLFGPYALTVTMGADDWADYIGRCSDPLNRHAPDDPDC